MTADSLGIRPELADMAGLVEELKCAWRDGQPPDAVAALSAFPSILAHRSLVIDLAYEEYCLREEAGDVPDAETFCSALPAYRSQMREVIRGHRVLADHPEVLANTPPEWPVAGDALDGMPLVRELGRGAFARVFLATDPRAGGRHVVLKLSQFPSAEAHTLGPIEHKNIVGIYWARKINRFHVICMPFVAATTLHDAIDSVRSVESPSVGTLLSAIEKNLAGIPRPPAAGNAVLKAKQSNWVASTVAMAAPLARALAYLHQRGTCHGDLKPSNILLGPGGIPYLIDFNLASDADTDVMRTGGTLPYMAPERIRAVIGQKPDSPRADRADVYSFGVVLFESLARRLPHTPIESEHVRAIAEDLLDRKLGATPILRVFNRTVPKTLAKLVEKCLDPDPMQRPSARQIGVELCKLQSRPMRRLRLVAASTAVLLATLIATSVLSNLPQSVHERAYAAKVVAPAEIADPFQRGVAHLGAGEVDSAMKAFADARRKQPDGPTNAYLAYCYSRAAKHELAANYYQEALDRGFNAAWVHNNLAYSLTQQSRNTPANLPNAMKQVSLALDLEPHTRGIQFNWAYIRFLSNFDSKTKRLDDDDCVHILLEVMSKGPYDAELFYKAGLILAAGADTDDERRQAIQYLGKAIELGKLPKNLAGDPVLRANLGGRSDFKELLALSPGTQVVSRLHLELVNPTE